MSSTRRRGNRKAAIAQDGGRAKARRPKGEGSYTQRSDGTWQYSIDLGKDADGKRQRRYFYARSHSALKRKIFDETAKSGGSLKPRAAGTVGEWMDRWLQHDVKPNLSRNTYALYESIWRVHVAPVLASRALERLDAEAVAMLYARLRENGASPTVVHRAGVLMQRAIAVATRRGLFHRPNPFALVDKPTPRPKEQHTLTVGEARRIIAVARDGQLRFVKKGVAFEEIDRAERPQSVPLEALFVLLLTTGLRLGEALALRWSDIDFDKRRLSVRRSLVEVGGVVEIGQPKTPGSRRAVELGSMALDALQRRRTEADREGHGSELVFSTIEGTPQRRSNVRRRHFEPILERAGVGHITIHGLRHAMTSFGIAEGIAPKILAERLGHSTVRLTQDRYAHVLPGLQRAAADVIDQLLR